MPRKEKSKAPAEPKARILVLGSKGGGKSTVLMNLVAAEEGKPASLLDKGAPAGLGSLARQYMEDNAVVDAAAAIEMSTEKKLMDVFQDDRFRSVAQYIGLEPFQGSKPDQNTCEQVVCPSGVAFIEVPSRMTSEFDFNSPPANLEGVCYVVDMEHYAQEIPASFETVKCLHSSLRVPIAVIFNKFDLFQGKVTQESFEQVCPKFAGKSVKDLDQVTRFLNEMFEEIAPVRRNQTSQNFSTYFCNSKDDSQTTFSTIRFVLLTYSKCNEAGFL